MWIQWNGGWVDGWMEVVKGENSSILSPKRWRCEVVQRSFYESELAWSTMMPKSLSLYLKWTWKYSGFYIHSWFALFEYRATYKKGIEKNAADTELNIVREYNPRVCRNTWHLIATWYNINNKQQGAHCTHLVDISAQLCFRCLDTIIRKRHRSLLFATFVCEETDLNICIL